jgi:hypothetical protein
MMGGRVCNLLVQLLLGLARAVTLGSKSRRTHYHILLLHLRDSSNLEGQVSVFISPRNRMAQLYPRALGSLFVASYYSQGHGEVILTSLHTGTNWHQSQSQSYQSASPSWCQAPIWDPRPIFSPSPFDYF